MTIQEIDNEIGRLAEMKESMLKLKTFVVTEDDHDTFYRNFHIPTQKFVHRYCYKAMAKTFWKRPGDAKRAIQ